MSFYFYLNYGQRSAEGGHIVGDPKPALVSIRLTCSICRIRIHLSRSRPCFKSVESFFSLFSTFLRFHVSLFSAKTHQDMHSHSIIQRDHPEVEEKPQKSLNEKQQENQELLIRCIAQHLGFAGNRPIAACIIYKCLLQWRSFEVERTSVFDRIIQTIGNAIEVQAQQLYLFFFFFFSFLWFCDQILVKYYLKDV